jgi:glycopeptide antibiotics resistance protein
MAVGLEISQALSNYFSNVVPPYRVDIHDVLARATGALAAYLLLKLLGAIWRLSVRPSFAKSGIIGFIDGVTRRI